MHERKQLTLKELRESCRLSQRKLAKLIGIKHGSSISNYEHGRRTPRLDVIQKIADIFGITLEDACNIFLFSRLQNENDTMTKRK